MKSVMELLSRHRTPIMALALVAALVLCAGLLLSPKMEKQRMIEHQNELLDSIAQGDGTIVLDEQFAAEPVDFYDLDVDGGTVEAGPDAEPEPAAEPVDGPTVVSGIGVLSIDRIGLTLPVTDGVSTAQLKVAVGWVPQTAPIGEEGNAVIAGHRSYTYGDFFNRLGELEPGDRIRYDGIDGELYEYEVYDLREVLPDDQTAFAQPDGEYELTLYTCTPIRTATHRLLVCARRVA